MLIFRMLKSILKTKVYIWRKSELNSAWTGVGEMTELTDPSRLKKGKETVLTKREILDLPVTQMDYSTLPDPNGQVVKIHNFAAKIGELRKQSRERKENS